MKVHSIFHIASKKLPKEDIYNSFTNKKNSRTNFERPLPKFLRGKSLVIFMEITEQIGDVLVKFVR
jgi:hypothetical protein